MTLTLVRRWPATFTTAVAAVIVLALGWCGPDFPAQILRIERFRAGDIFWNHNWFGGHPTLGYSALLPALGAVLGAWGLGVVSTTISVAAFERIVRGHPRALGATAAFAFGMLSNLVVGRLAFALGVAFGLSALATLRRAPKLSIALAAGCALSSPVAAVFLAIAFAAWAYTNRRYRFGAILVAAAIAPAAFTSIAFGTGGTFPMPITTAAWSVALCVLVAIACDDATVRLGCALYAVLGVGTFVVASPLGANVGRLPMLFAAPLLVLADPLRTKRLLLAGVPVLAAWQGLQITQVAAAAGTDPSLARGYHTGVIEYLERQPQPVLVEIPFTEHHWETAYVAEEIPIARGWERQIDTRLNPEFYDPRGLDEGSYEAWLRRNHVTHVALPDTAFDYSSVMEAQLVADGLDYLTPIWRDAHWVVYEVEPVE